MDKLVQVQKLEDIFPAYRNTPIEKLFAYHNLGFSFDEYSKAEILIGMCMDNRKYMTIPEKFAYIIRTGGANLRYSEFKVSFAIAIGGIKAIALIAHNHCGMVNLMSKREAFIDGLVENGGWEKTWAEEHFNQFAPMFELGSEVDFVIAEAKRLRMRYPKVLVVPLYYKMEDNLLYMIREY